MLNLDIEVSSIKLFCQTLHKVAHVQLNDGYVAHKLDYEFLCNSEQVQKVNERVQLNINYSQHDDRNQLKVIFYYEEEEYVKFAEGAINLAFYLENSLPSVVDRIPIVSAQDHDAYIELALCWSREKHASSPGYLTAHGKKKPDLATIKCEIETLKLAIENKKIQKRVSAEIEDKEIIREVTKEKERVRNVRYDVQSRDTVSSKDDLLLTQKLKEQITHLEEKLQQQQQEFNAQMVQKEFDCNLLNNKIMEQQNQIEKDALLEKARQQEVDQLRIDNNKLKQSIQILELDIQNLKSNSNQDSNQAIDGFKQVIQERKMQIDEYKIKINHLNQKNQALEKEKENLVHHYQTQMLLQQEKIEQLSKENNCLIIKGKSIDRCSVVDKIPDMQQQHIQHLEDMVKELKSKLDVTIQKSEITLEGIQFELNGYKRLTLLSEQKNEELEAELSQIQEKLRQTKQNLGDVLNTIAEIGGSAVLEKIERCMTFRL